jgi:hypothetical protein
MSERILSALEDLYANALTDLLVEKRSDFTCTSVSSDSAKMFGVKKRELQTDRRLVIWRILRPRSASGNSSLGLTNGLGVATGKRAGSKNCQQKSMIPCVMRGTTQWDRTMMPEVFPARTEFANVNGFAVSCNDHGIYRAWDTVPDRKFSISAVMVDGIFITQTVFRELATKVNLK